MVLPVPLSGYGGEVRPYASWIVSAGEGGIVRAEPDPRPAPRDLRPFLFSFSGSETDRERPENLEWGSSHGTDQRGVRGRQVYRQAAAGVEHPDDLLGGVVDLYA